MGIGFWLLARVLRSYRQNPNVNELDKGPSNIMSQRICQIPTVRISPVRGLIFIAPDAVRGYNSVRHIGPQELFIELIIIWPALTNDIRLRSFVFGSTRGVVMLHVRECGPENVRIDARFPAARSHSSLLCPRTLSGATICGPYRASGEGRRSSDFTIWSWLQP